MRKKHGVLTKVNKFDVWILKHFSKMFWLNVKEIGENAFSNKPVRYSKLLDEISIPDGVTKIGQFGLMLAMPKKISIPKTIKNLEMGAFCSCYNLKELEIPEGIETIESFLCSNCQSLEKVKIPESVKKIKQGAFENCCSLKSIEIPRSVENIARYVFRGCEHLENVTLPVGVKFDNLKNYIDEYAFQYCNCIKTINLIMPDESIMTINIENFSMIDSTEKLTKLMAEQFDKWKSKHQDAQDKDDITLTSNASQEENSLKELDTLQDDSVSVLFDDLYGLNEELDDMFYEEEYDELVRACEELFGPLYENTTAEINDTENKESSSNNLKDESQPY